MMKFVKKLRQIIKMAVLTSSNDSASYPQGQCSYNGKITNFVRLSPYGLCSNPPSDSLVLLLSSQAQESVKFGISDDMVNRLKNLAVGEVALYNYDSKSLVHIKQNGDIDVVSTANVNVQSAANVNVDAVAQVNITAPNINLTGVVTINGTLATTGTGSATIDGTLEVTDHSILDSAEIDGIEFITHRHSGVQTGSGNSGGPV